MRHFVGIESKNDEVIRVQKYKKLYVIEADAPESAGWLRNVASKKGVKRKSLNPFLEKPYISI
jgi:hypothetical protein